MVAFLTALYLIFVVRFWSNVPYIDDWNSVWLVSQALHGHVSWDSLWIQHNENRMLVPNLILIALGVVSHENLKVVIVVDVALCVGAFVVFLSLLTNYLARALTPTTVLAVGVVWFSVVDWQTALWGFQLALSLILLLFVLMLFALLREDPGRWPYVLALAAAIVASVSSIQGLLLWPVGILCLMWISPTWRSVRTKVLIWAGAAIVTAVLYFVGYQSTPAIPGGLVPREIFGITYTNTSPAYLLHHPWTGVQFLLAEMGNVVPIGGSTLWPREIVGLVLCIGTAYVITQCIRQRRAGDRTRCLPMALIAFSVLFDLVSVIGRSELGLQLALASRYTMSNLLLVLAIVIYALHSLRTRTAPRRRTALVVAGIALLAVQVVTATNYGITQGSALQRYLTTEARLASNADRIPSQQRVCYQETGLLVYGLPNFNKSFVEDLQHQGLTFYAPGTYRTYRAEGLPDFHQCADHS